MDKRKGAIKRDSRLSTSPKADVIRGVAVDSNNYLEKHLEINVIFHRENEGGF